MNGTEQRNHTKVTTQLTHALENVAARTGTRLDHLDGEVVRLRESISDERTHRLKLADEQRAYVDRQDRELCQFISDHRERIGNLMGAHVGFTTRGFWSRLNWLVTGR